MSENAPILVWFRRDLRLADHPALAAAAETGRPVIPVFIFDETLEPMGAAPRFRLGVGLERFATSLTARGSRLILRRGDALGCLQELLSETGARAVWWNRAYDPASIERDKPIKAAFTAAGIEARSFAGNVLFEPWTVQTQTGGFFRVYTPMWKAVRARDLPGPHPAPARLVPPSTWPRTDELSAWELSDGMQRGAAVVAPHLRIGEDAALARLDWFMDGPVDLYHENRDIPAVDGTSGLSQNLALGEIGPSTCWQAGMRALAEGKSGAEVFLKELVWREFAYHLIYHTPHIGRSNWRPEWDAFPWNEDEARPDVLAWKMGRTGLPFVDAAMRQMYVTGTMHNRGRMIVASYLTKHLMSHWRIGLRWFEDCLVDWDPASNAMGWQWSAGSGPDATPYFRVFNPETQLDKFDPKGAYQDAWIAEGRANPTPTALSYFDAIPLSWRLRPSDPYPEPIVSPKDGRARALAAYQARDF
ncbi:MAG: deoxyribodipyrimidine photo-lyase [Pseudomonadota bacterium]